MSAVMFHKTASGNVEQSELINSGRDTMYNVQNNYSIGVFPDVISFFHAVAQRFIAWTSMNQSIGEDGKNPLPQVVASDHDPALHSERDMVEISSIMPSNPSSWPVSSIADRYTRSMLECLVGYPLYSPKPFSESKEYGRNGVNIGDVGFVRADGTFDFLFNICPSQNARDLDPLPQNTCIFTQAIAKTESDGYICNGSEGATLVLPEGAVQAEAIYTGWFEDLAKRHGVEWYEYTKTRGRSISNGSLYLVTSFTKCTKWGIAVFDRRCSPGQTVSFVSNPPGWKGSGALFTKVVDPNQGNTPNQCVFLRGYKIMIRQDIFDNLPTRQPASRIRGGGIGFLSKIKGLLTGESTLAQYAAPDARNSDEVILHANFNSSPIHPSDFINAELLSQNSDVKVAVTHDTVWCDILRGNFPKFDSEILVNTARSYTCMIDKYGSASLVKGAIQETDTLDLTSQIKCTTELIGRGGFASVYKGRWLDEAVNGMRPPIVVKVMNRVPPSTSEKKKERQSKRIERELELWRKIDHKNILPLLGIIHVNADANMPAFVSPWMKNGNAKQFRLSTPTFPPLRIISDVIKGLHYLHTFEPEIVHGDIKAVNVLINDQYEACLCDFGLSRFLVDSTLWRPTVTQAGGSLRWMSPELMIGEWTPTKESDIYAYAMTCYEILTGDIPFKSVTNEANLIYNVTVEKHRPKRVKSCDSDSIWDIITKGWAEKPEDRPRTAEVLKLVQKIEENSGPPLILSSVLKGQTHLDGRRTETKTGKALGKEIKAEISTTIQISDVLDLTGQIECTAEFIGRGGYANIYKGRWVEESANATQPPTVVRVMILPMPIDEKQKERQSKKIKREVKIWGKMNHKNILPLIGITYNSAGANSVSFISPWMKNGNARQFRSLEPSFPPLHILYDIIQGLHYLHTFEPEIVHGNIKADNVLINDRYEACLCDFELSRFLTDSTRWGTTAARSTGQGGTLRWMSPELITGEQSDSTKESDIYAYAMTCYEILTGDIPFNSVKHAVRLLAMIVDGRRPERIDSCISDPIWDIITRCWAEKPEDRPQTTEVLELVGQIKMEQAGPEPQRPQPVLTPEESRERLDDNRTDKKPTEKGNDMIDDESKTQPFVGAP